MVPTTVTTALAATGCDASIATAKEIAGNRYASLFMMSPLHVQLMASGCSVLR
jgi:hypothetical protein